jgi:hypothetical protein
VRRARSASGELVTGWVVVWPGYGFSTATTSSAATIREALGKVGGLASAGPILERQVAGYLPGFRAGQDRRYRPRWIE